jgi:hypothetical protein
MILSDHKEEANHYVDIQFKSVCCAIFEQSSLLIGGAAMTAHGSLDPINKKSSSCCLSVSTDLQK